MSLLGSGLGFVWHSSVRYRAASGQASSMNPDTCDGLNIGWGQRGVNSQLNDLHGTLMDKIADMDLKISGGYGDQVIRYSFWVGMPACMYF